MNFKYCLILILSTTCILKAESLKDLSYINIEILNSKLSAIGFGHRKISNKNCFDCSLLFKTPYKHLELHRFYPVSFALNYLYFPKNNNTYLGAGIRYRIDISNNYFSPIQINPCLTLGVLCKVGNRDCFVELKSNFLRFIKLMCDNNKVDYPRKIRKEALKSHSFSVNFGTYF